MSFEVLNDERKRGEGRVGERRKMVFIQSGRRGKDRVDSIVEV